MQRVARHFKYFSGAAGAGDLSGATSQDLDNITAFHLVKRTTRKIRLFLFFRGDPSGYIYLLQYAVGRQQYTALYEVLQFPDISRPGIAAQLLYDFWCDLSDLPAGVPAVFLDEEVR